HSGFERLPNNGGPQKYWCIICDCAEPCLKGSLDKHMTSAMHQESLKQLTLMSELAHRNRKDNLNHSEYRHTPSEVADGHSSLGSNKEIDSENEDEHEDVGMDPADWGYPLHLDHDTGEKEEEEPGMIFWDWHWGNETSANNDEPSTLGPNRSYTQPGPQRSQRIPANAPWYPFPTKEVNLNLLLYGFRIC
ncbi:hypothetical protein PSHT_13932, partial [Puccinia striiformis]